MQEVIDELIEHQKKVFLALGRRIVPHVTLDDLMQPNDFPALEHHPAFRYEEGVLHGLQMAKASAFYEGRQNGVNTSK
jgi:hypothetical protein